MGNPSARTTGVRKTPTSRTTARLGPRAAFTNWPEDGKSPCRTVVIRRERPDFRIIQPDPPSGGVEEFMRPFLCITLVGSIGLSQQAELYWPVAVLLAGMVGILTSLGLWVAERLPGRAVFKSLWIFTCMGGLALVVASGLLPHITRGLPVVSGQYAQPFISANK